MRVDLQNRPFFVRDFDGLKRIHAFSTGVGARARPLPSLSVFTCYRLERRKNILVCEQAELDFIAGDIEKGVARLQNVVQYWIG